MKEDVVRVCEEAQLVWQNMGALHGYPVTGDKQKDSEVVQPVVEGADFKLESTYQAVSRSRDQQWEQVQKIRLMCAKQFERVKESILEFVDFK